MKPRAAAFAGVTMTAALVLSGCAGATSPGGEMITELGENEGAVSILAWPGYVEDGSNDPAVDWTSSFEEATGCEVTVKTYGTSDEAVNLMKTGEYDVVAASGDATQRLIAGGEVMPINTSLVPSYEGIFEFLKNQSHNTVDGVNYGIPHGYGANLLQYNADVVTPAPDSWSVVWDEGSKYAGKVTAYDSPIYIADAAVYLMATKPELGIKNPYALDETQLEAAIELLKAQRENVGEYWADYLLQIQAFTTGDSVVGTTWQVITNVLQAEGANVEAVLPKEGSTGWSDTWMVSSKTDAPNCSYRWLDHIASPEINAAATAYFGEAPSSMAACDFRDDCDAYHAGDEEYAKQLWYWTTPIEKCLDGRTDVQCTNYARWTEAWQEVKG